MITVTLGTIPYPFNRMTSWLDSLLREGIVTETVFLQHGSTDLQDLAYHNLITAVPLLSGAELAEKVSASRLVIAHAGQGTTRMLAAQSTSFVITPRLAQHGEHIDDHQLLFAKGVERLGVNVCMTRESLEAAIKQPPTPLNKDLFSGKKLGDYLARKYPNRVVLPVNNSCVNDHL